MLLVDLGQECEVVHAPEQALAVGLRENVGAHLSELVIDERSAHLVGGQSASRSVRNLSTTDVDGANGTNTGSNVLVLTNSAT